VNDWDGLKPAAGRSTAAARAHLCLGWLSKEHLATGGREEGQITFKQIVYLELPQEKEHKPKENRKKTPNKHSILGGFYKPGRINKQE
jgi:hypothetical protein